ncbi:MAG: hypothetical protein ABSG31_11245 [Tepidisphaeraceae bacterium]|jgi:hypothetical protein
MDPKLYHAVRIVRDDPSQRFVAGAEGYLLDWLDAPPGDEKGAIVELYDRPDDPVVTVPASWLEAISDPQAADKDRPTGKARRAG